MAWSKESRHARGYGSHWDKLRLVILKRDKYLCQCPDCQGGKKRFTPANEVNHKVSKAEGKRLGWTQAQVDHLSNLEAINSQCHRKLTDAQVGRKAKVKIGVDGFPIA